MMIGTSEFGMSGDACIAVSIWVSSWDGTFPAKSTKTNGVTSETDSRLLRLGGETRKTSNCVSIHDAVISH